jgi:hypothetical protein
VFKSELTNRYMSIGLNLLWIVVLYGVIKVEEKLWFHIYFFFILAISLAIDIYKIIKIKKQKKKEMNTQQ